jgi:hypothetical protein
MGMSWGGFIKAQIWKNIIVDGSMRHIKHHTINYKCDKLNCKVL